MVLVASVLLLRVTITHVYLSLYAVDHNMEDDVRQTDIPVGFVIYYMIFYTLFSKYLTQLDRTYRYLRIPPFPFSSSRHNIISSIRSYELQ